MSPPDNSPAAAAAQHRPLADPAPASPGPQSPEAVAHELANLLDGSLRNLGLVLTSLRDAAAPASSDALADRLQAARTAMNQMVSLIRRWVDTPHPALELEHDTRTVAEAVDHAVRLLTPAAETRHIRIQVQLADRAARLDAGPVYPVLANALRNSIEAIDSVPAASPNRGGLIQISVRLDGEHLEMSVADDGPGLSSAVLTPDGRVCPGKTTKPSGHGLGLQLCLDVAQSLAGSLDLHNRSPRGAQLILRYPWRKTS